MDKKKNILVLFGGQSSEHEISCISVKTVLKALNPDIYAPAIVGITKKGRWLYVPSLKEIEDGSWKNGSVSAILSPDATQKCLLLLNGTVVTRIPIDVAFPVLHGKYGEDGTIQGLLELAQIPYVGCGVFASAVSMDKVHTKGIVKELGIRQARYVWLHYKDLEDMDACAQKVEAELSYPVFVKPSKAGSSCGVSHAHDRAELLKAFTAAVEIDSKILIEETISGREVECAVLGTYAPEASGVGEILAAESFYSYDAKYNNPDSQTDIHPMLPEGKEEEIRRDAEAIFRAVDGFGLSRVDFFIENGTDEVVFNEINTMPGFTSISMYPMLWNSKGISPDRLVEQLIAYAFERI